MTNLYPSDAQRRAALRHILGTVLFIAAGLYFVMLPAGLAAGSALTALLHFGVPGVILAGSGMLLRRAHRGDTRLRMSDAGAVVFWGWMALVISAMPPFITMSGMSGIQALFESVSGWTTTGLSVVDYTRTHALIFLWRSLLQLGGGAGLAILLVSLAGGVSGSLYSRVEGRELLAPQVRDSARIVLKLYAVYLVTGVAAYTIVGMNLFEAFNHACAAISTGGFSNRPQSIGAWDAVSVEAVSIALMLLGNFNFITGWLIARRRWTAVFRNSELRLMSFALLAGSVLVYLFTTMQVYGSFTKDARVAVFETVSALTTTGFSTVLYGGWQHTGLLVLIILMVIGGGACSTAGGLKQIRVYILWKSLLRAVRQFMLPRGATLPLRVHDGEAPRSVSDEEVSALSAFTFAYLALLGAGTIVLTMHGYSLVESLFEFASALGTVGISIGITGPLTPDIPLLAMTAGMLLGRLEIFLVFIGLRGALRQFRR